ncbi:helix-turn-helix domain-containing protein [Candidatus Magnetobacterium casense]|uniref:Helix-turn-helix transcriptional regulator n=1 Tax=Candidatus Magnetobacterium casense TaxID=1455061 RepID=A0ABS6S2Q9_9BACT|nr:helix-turn-helix transcriptional regulator [Candidatus Magnetobacterium casensis]MBV6343126.1 helix-turn-helix transcriptional regulator [Candidatus Magnetobacterium casensis]
MNQFGDSIRKRRKELKLTLRTFCRLNGIDAANHSRLERGISKPPKDIAYIAKALYIKPDSDEYNEFALYADVERGEVPKDIMNKVSLALLLPTIWCAMRKTKSRNKLEGLIELLQKTLRGKP